MKNRYLSLSLLFFFSTTIIFAQQLKGRVLSLESLEPIAYATIHIFAPDSSALQSFAVDQYGQFSKKITESVFSIKITAVGFGDKKIEIKRENAKEIDLGDIHLVNEAVLLDDITITSDNIIQYVDRNVVIPSRQQYQASTNGIDLLYALQLPGLFVDPISQKVSINNTSQVEYKINGVPSSLQEILGLKADNILRIEYSDIPSGKEAWTNTGVVNYILRQSSSGTLLSASILGAVSTGFLNGNLTAKSVHEKSELSINYQINYRDYSKRWLDETTFYHFPDTLIGLHQKGSFAPFGYTTHNVILGYTYNTAKHIFNIRLTNLIHDSFDRNNIDVYREGESDWLYHRDIYSKTKIYLPSLNLYYIRNIEKDRGLEVNLVASMTDNEYSRTLNDIYADLDYEIANNSDEDRKSLIFEAYYYHNKSELFNYNVGVRNSNSFVTNIYNDNKSSQTRIDVYPYFTIRGKIRSLSYQLSTGLKIQSDKNDEDSKVYFRNASTLTMTYNKSSFWNIRNTIQYNSYLPSLSMMNNNIIRQNDLLVFYGNTELKPYDSFSERLVFTYRPKKNIRSEITFNYSHVFNPIDYNFFYDAGQASLVMQPINQDFNKTMSLSGYLQLSSLMNFLTLSGGGDWSRYLTKGDGYSLDRDDLTWFISATAVYRYFSFECGYRKPSKRLSGQYVNLGENYSSVGINYKNKNFSAGIGMYYPFTYGTKYGTELTAPDYQYKRNVYIKDNANMVYFRLSYSFSSGKSVFNINQRLRNSDSDSSIFKVRDN